MCPVQLSVDTFIHSNLTHISFSSSIYRRRELQVLVSVITRHTRCVAVVAAHRTTSKSQYAPSVDIQLKRCDHVSSWIKPSEKNCLCLWRCILTYPLVCVSSNTRQSNRKLPSLFSHLHEIIFYEIPYILFAIISKCDMSRFWSIWLIRSFFLFTDNWSEKAKRRKTTGTGRCRYLKIVRRRFRNGFREGGQAKPRTKQTKA